jgi:hypothetical protein
MKAQKGQLYTFFNLGARWGGWLTPRPGSFTPWNDSVSSVQEDEWAQRPVRTCTENLASIGTRSSDRLTCSESLYRLNYPGAHQKLRNLTKHTDTLWGAGDDFVT